MEASAEQKEIVDFSSTMIVNAGAGSGKTYTCGLIAEANKGSNILYLTFNRRNMLDGNKKFTELGLTNIKAKTVHQLALDYLRQNGLPSNIKKGGYKNYEILNAIESPDIPEDDLVKISDHILKYFSCFCNSAANKIQETPYESYLTTEPVRIFYQRYEDVIVNMAKNMFSEMWYGNIEIDFDFALKRYERSNPRLDYDIIILDEAQDSSDAIISIFDRQRAIKIAVGDHNQSIYSWRYAVDSMKKLDYKKFSLTGSYRFNSTIAFVANQFLLWKKSFGIKNDFQIRGLNTNTDYDPMNIAFLARKNSGLFHKAIAMLDIPNSDNIKMLFEGDGGLRGYLYSDSGISIWDVIHIGLGNRNNAKSPIAKRLGSVEKMLEFAKSNNDVALKNFCELYDFYGIDLERKIKKIKSLEVKAEDEVNPDIIFSTVHKSKGREYNVVELCDDFLTYEKLLKEYRNPESAINIEEEINLLYVAVTRAKYKVVFEEEFDPVETNKINNIS